MLILSTVVFSFFGCGGVKSEKQVYTEPTDTPAAESEKTPEASQSPTSEANLFNHDFIVPDPSIRPVAVMIDNQGNRVLPQGGIGQAQIVYEILTEYNITRYMALFWGTMPEMIGPVRSSRHYFLDYALEYDAVYTHFGWSVYAKNDIAKLKINNINGLIHGDAFWDISKDKGNWQDSYTSKDRITKQIEALKYSNEPKKTFPFTYEDQLKVLDNGQKAEDVFIRFGTSGSSSCGYLYHASSMMFKRIRMGSPQTDRNTGEPIMVTNIIVQEIFSHKIKNDNYGCITLDNIGSGQGYYITAGKAQKIKWTKNKRDAQTQYTAEDGKPLSLNRGQTWVEIVPDIKQVKLQ